MRVAHLWADPEQSESVDEAVHLLFREARHFASSLHYTERRRNAPRDAHNDAFGRGTPQMTSSQTAVTAAALTATFGLAAASWVVAVRQMDGMDMGVATRLGSFALFVALWLPMMAAMMLPSAAPAVLRRAHAGGHVLRAVPLFIASYLAV
jgi:hypothetical protein